MNRKQIGKIAFLAIVASFIGLTSCHRGYGCPTNLKAGSVVVTTAVKVVKNF